MKTHFKILGIAFWVSFAPMAALAQGVGQAGSNLDGTVPSPDSNVPGANANPFTGAAGADKFYQDNSLTGASQSNGSDTNSDNNNLSSSNPDGTLPPPDATAPAVDANPFTGAAGANKFYQDNSLTGAAQPNNGDALGGSVGDAETWATTP
jgi:hypothetical protein